MIEMDRSARGSLIRRLPYPTSRYLTLGVLALLAALGVYAAFAGGSEAVFLVVVVVVVELVCWVALLRPSIAAYDNGLQLTNMVRDVFIPWEHIENVRALSTFQVVTEERRFSCVGVVTSTRAQLKQSKAYGERPTVAKMMLGTKLAGMVDGPPEQDTASRTLTAHIEDLVRGYVHDGQRRWKKAGSPDRPIVQQWALLPVLALLAAVAAILIGTQLS